MFNCENSIAALDLSKDSTLKNDSIIAQLISWNQLSLNLNNTLRMKQDSGYESGSPSGSENSKETIDLTLSPKSSSTQSSPSPSVVLAAKPRRHPHPLAKIYGKDEDYIERRRKNNLAAKKSRDAKKMRELMVHQQLILLRDENSKLKRALAGCVCNSMKNTAAVFYPTRAYGGFQMPFHDSSLLPPTTRLTNEIRF